MPECKVTPIVPVSSERPYRLTPTEEEALAELVNGAGTQWDPEVVKVFLKLRRSATKRKGKGKREREQWYHRLADGFDCHCCPTTLR